MDGMYSAIKNRRGGLLNDEEENAHQAPAEKKPMYKGSGMEGLVASLDDIQKMELLKLLSADMSEGGDTREIEKGGMGPGEMAELEEEAGMGETEDEIAADMVSSADVTRAEQGTAPRNLGERARIEMAKKLKNKKGV